MNNKKNLFRKYIGHALMLTALGMPLTAVAQSWPTSSDEAKAGARWWIFGSAVDTANIRWNMEQYASHGIGALEITPIYGVQGEDSREIPYLSDKWMEMLRFTMEQGKRLGIEIDMATGTGWPFGGPWVPLEESTSKMVIVEGNGEGKKVDHLQLTAKDNKPENCRFVGAYAFGEGGAYADLTSSATDAGKGSIVINAKLPSKGKWRIVALFQKLGVMKVKRPAPGGEGWVVDHFNKSSVEHYLKHISDAFDRTGTPYPHTFFNDSYEVSEGDYTPQLFEEFEKRRGYSLKEKFNLLVDGDKKVVADYRETLGDLILENFTKTWTAWAHSHGAITRNQAHGSPANLLDCYAAVDIPEIEGFGLSEFGIKGLRTDAGFTRKNDSDFSMLKWAPSAAHVSGKKYASSETFTWLTEHFRTSLSQMKPDLDLMFCAGVNHMFFHGTAYSPKEAQWPGWKFYASVDMSPTNSQWRDAPFLMKYIQRCQSFLQWGKPDNDFLVYLPVRDIWNTRSTGKRLMQFAIHNMGALAPDFIKAVLAIDKAGFDCDYISEQQLQQVTVNSDGSVTTASGQHYKGVIIPKSDVMLTKDLEEKLNEMQVMHANVIYGSDNVEAMGNIAKAEEIKSRLGLKMIRRRNDCGYHYFIANLTPENVDEAVELGVKFENAMWFDPMNGKRYRADIKQDGKVRLDLRSGESMILETFDSKGSYDAAALGKLSTRKDSLYDRSGKMLTGGWQLTFKESVPEIDATYNIDNLQSWENIDDSTRVLMGTGVYDYTLTLSKNDVKGCNDWAIDLGDVRESARVYINGTLIGCAWAVPYVLQFSDLLHAGQNDIRIEVTNLGANRIAQMDRDGVNWRRMKDINIVDIHYKKNNYSNWTPMPSGLNSRVFMYRVK